jgi:hypothetical protein
MQKSLKYVIRLSLVSVFGEVFKENLKQPSIEIEIEIYSLTLMRELASSLAVLVHILPDYMV